MKTFLRALGFVFLVSAFAGSAWANTVWNLNADFTYNSTANTATGTITLDPSLNVVTWDITVDGTNVPADNVYTPGDSFAIFPDLTHLDFYDGATGQYIDLYLSSPFSDAGGTIALLPGDDGESNNSTIVCAGCGVLGSGNVMASSATPEPASVDLLGTAVGLLAIVAMRRREILARMF